MAMTYFLDKSFFVANLQKNMFDYIFWNILQKEFENKDSSAGRHLVRRGSQLNDGKGLHIRQKKHKKTLTKLNF